MKNVVLTAAAACVVASGALAQSTGSASSHPAAKDAATALQPAAPAAHQTNLSQQMQTTLQQSGFTDVKVVPDSFLVRAKDKSGNPVTMFIGPNSVTEVVGGTGKGASSTTASANTFTTVPSSDKLSSSIVGLNVYNKANQDIGSIKDVAYSGHQVQAYIVGVGGFLGLGDRYVAVDPSALQVSWNDSEKKWHASLDATADQLKAAPQYTYPSKG